MHDPIGYRVVVVAPEQAEFQPAPADDRPLGDDELHGRTVVSLVSTGTELAVYRGPSGKYPKYPGYAAIFAVDAVGSEVTDAAPGDLFFCMGSHRSHQRCARQEAVPVPAGVSAAQAVFCRIMAVSMSTLVTTTARPPGRVLLTGLGLVGNLAAQIFASCGYQVIGCDPAEAKRQIACRCGLEEVYESAGSIPEQLARQIDLALECSGHEQAAREGCQLVRRGGEVVLIGVPWEPRAPDLRAWDILHPVFHKYVVLRSGWEWQLPRRAQDFRAGSIFANLAAAMRWIGQERVTLKEHGEVRSPQEPQTAYQDLLHGRTSKLGVVFDWGKVTAPTAGNR